VVAVSRDGDHRFSKPETQEILLLAGLGVHGDAHAGTTVQHRSRVAAHTAIVENVAEAVPQAVGQPDVRRWVSATTVPW
jgi:hypothetical protein